MYVLLRALPTLVLVLIFGVGTWVRPAQADIGARVQSSVGPAIATSGNASGSQQEEKPSGESSDGDGESVEDGKVLGVHEPKVEMPRGPELPSSTLNDELPLRSRETTRELFRPPRG